MRRQSAVNTMRVEADPDAMQLLPVGAQRKFFEKIEFLASPRPHDADRSPGVTAAALVPSAP
jgi:hypothetical protein